MADATTRIVVSHWVHAEVLSYLRSFGEVVANETRDSWSREMLIQQCRGADALMAFMPDRIDAAFLEECPRLRIIAAALKGYDNIDVAACTRRGVWVSIVPDMLTEPTAELAVTLLLSLIRNVLPGDRLVRSGNFNGWRPALYGATISGSTVGIVGMGAVGQAIARRIQAFGADIIYFDPRRLSKEKEERLAAVSVPFGQLLRRADHIMLAAPLMDGCYHLLRDDSLRHVKPSAYVVNVGRGSVVDEQAIAAGLRAGKLRGYAADVFEMEDLSLERHPRNIPNSLIQQTEKTVFTPHLGSAVDQARRNIALEAARGIEKALSGVEPLHALNTSDRKTVQPRGEQQRFV